MLTSPSRPLPPPLLQCLDSTVHAAHLPAYIHGSQGHGSHVGDPTHSGNLGWPKAVRPETLDAPRCVCTFGSLQPSKGIYTGVPHQALKSETLHRAFDLTPLPWIGANPTLSREKAADPAQCLPLWASQAAGQHWEGAFSKTAAAPGCVRMYLFYKFAGVLSRCGSCGFAFIRMNCFNTV